MNFYSEYGEDDWIFHNLKLPERGFYVDVGALHPEDKSNTAFLRDMGWQGLAIDGHPDCEAQWSGVAGVTFHCALVSDAAKDVGFFSDGPCSRITDGRDRSANILGAIIASHGIKSIDFLSIDIEGEEFNAMTSFNFAAYRPAVIVAEYATLQPDGSAAHDFRLRDYLLSLGYREEHRTTANIIYAT